MDAHETHETPSPASSITKLGIVRFVIHDPPEDRGDVPAGAVDLPTFTDESISRSTPNRPPPADRRDAAAPVAVAVPVPTPIYDYDDVLEPAPLLCDSDLGRVRSSTLPGVEPFRAAARRAS